MSYLDQTNRNRPRTIAAVAILHAGLGYLIVSGLAYTVISHTPLITKTDIYSDPPTPPPHDIPPPPRTTPRADPPPTATDTLVKTNVQDTTEIKTFTFEQPKQPDIVMPPPPPQTLKPSLARPAEAGAGRAGWVTSDDYPPQPLREEVTGTVGISVAIGTDGRVQGCEVTKSSGNAELDATTCRIYARRAHFKPALDADGKPTTTHFADRIRWQLPVQ